MGRARGRRNPTRPGGWDDPGPGTPGGDETGESIRQDPSGWISAETGNIVNKETTRQEVATGEPMDQWRGMMAHGVPHEADSTEERALAERGGANAVRAPRAVKAEKPKERPPAVPVYIVQEQGGPDSYRSASPRHVTVASNASDATRLGGRNPRRNRIGLLNEDGTTDVRFAVSPRDLIGGGGAILFHGVTAYLWLETQDELYALTTSASLSVTVSVIEEFDQEL